MRRRAATTPALPLLWLAFVALTTVWAGWNAQAQAVSDLVDYQPIVDAAPGFPGIDVPLQQAQRFALPWAAGSLSALTGAGSHAVTWALAGVAVLALVVLVARLVQHAHPSVQVVAVGLVAASPYPVRYALAVPGMLPDVAFALAVVGLVAAHVARRAGWLAGCLALACLSRPQSAVPLGLALVVLEASRGRRSPAALAAWALAPVAAYVLLDRVTAGFALPRPDVLDQVTVVGALRDLPGSAPDLARQLARVVAGVGPCVALLLVAVRAGRRLPPTAAAGLLLGVVVAAQPLALAPGYTHGAELRLAALGLPALVVGVAPLVTRLRAPAAVVSAVALASLHHLWSRAPWGEGVHVALVVLAGGVLGVAAAGRGGAPCGAPAS